jgi:DNA-binding transcriptional MerR regulator
MIPPSSFRTHEIAAAAQMSVQQVRNFEAERMIPAVERSPSGYRRYNQQHLQALKAARLLSKCYGRPRAQLIMQAAHQGRMADALALIDERHAELDHTRHRLEETLTTLSVLAAQLPAATHAHTARRLRVGEAARLVSVRVSAVRYWEQQGLLVPVREHGSNYRVYDETQLRRLHIVALLRQANYDFPAIRTALHELEVGQPQRAVAAVERRRHELALVSWRCLEAAALFYLYASEFLGGVDGR